MEGDIDVLPFGFQLYEGRVFPIMTCSLTPLPVLMCCRGTHQQPKIEVPAEISHQSMEQDQLKQDQEETSWQSLDQDQEGFMWQSADQDQEEFMCQSVEQNHEKTSSSSESSLNSHLQVGALKQVVSLLIFFQIVQEDQLSLEHVHPSPTLLTLSTALVPARPIHVSVPNSDRNGKLFEASSIQ